MTQFKPVLIKPVIAVDALDKTDIRVSTIEQLKDIPKSDRLVKLLADFRDHRRTILAGLKQEGEKPAQIYEHYLTFDTSD